MSYSFPASHRLGTDGAMMTHHILVIIQSLVFFASPCTLIKLF